MYEITGEKINVSQGYSKCSLCIVNENSVITEDDGIAEVLKRHNMDVLKISAGDVLLSGLDYGFLGGLLTLALIGTLDYVILKIGFDSSLRRDKYFTDT